MGEQLLVATVSADDGGVAACAAGARGVAEHRGAQGDAVALAVRLLADDARARLDAAAEPNLRLEIDEDGTELLFRVCDRGEPVSGALSSVLSLAELGLITGTDGRIEDGGNVRTVRVALPSHSAVVSGDGLEVLDEEVPISDAPVSLMTMMPSHAAALVRCIYRCYGWTYPNGDFYYPERVEAMYESGRRLGEIAVDDESGEVVAHWGAVFLADGVVETGVAITDPRYRRRGLLADLGDRLLDRLHERGVSGRMREPVMTHSATQHLALKEGAHLVGLHLHVNSPLKQVGITDGVLTSRVSLTVMYGPLAPLQPTTLWLPSSYEPIVRRLLEPTGWPREIGEVRGAQDAPALTVAGSSFDVANLVGSIEVSTVGQDLIDVVDQLVEQFRRAGAQAIHVTLPASQPALAVIGAGLDGLGLSFASFIPSFGALGDALVLQWLADRDIDTSSWQYATDHVAEMAGVIIEQARAVGEADAQLRRRHARRQQLFAALG